MPDSMSGEETSGDDHAAELEDHHREHKRVDPNSRLAHGAVAIITA